MKTEAIPLFARPWMDLEGMTLCATRQTNMHSARSHLYVESKTLRLTDAETRPWFPGAGSQEALSGWSKGTNFPLEHE